MFDDVMVAKKIKVSHKQKKQDRSQPTKLEISILVNDKLHKIKVLRPSHPRDRLWIRLTAEEVTAVFQYIR